MIIYETMSTMINIKLLWNIYESLWHLQQLQDLQGFPGFADAGEIVLKGPVLGPGPFFGRTEDRTGPKNFQNQTGPQKTAKNRSEPVCSGPRLNVLKSGLNPQKHQKYRENKL